MQAPGLYFPHIHIRDDNWLKSAALYWPSIYRFVPFGHRIHDSPTAQTFAAAGVLRDERLKDSFGTWLGLQYALRENADELVSRFRIDQEILDRHADHGSAQGLPPTSDRGRLAWIHIQKFPGRALDQLEALGLAIRWRPDPNDLDSLRRLPRSSYWIGLHPAVADAYLTALAGQVSKRAGFQPLTDEDDLHRSVPTSDAEAALRLLVGPDIRQQPQQDYVQRYVMVALQVARPRELEHVAAETILSCREDLEEELEVFRGHVANQVAELEGIASIAIEHRQLEAFKDHVQTTIEKPLVRLEHALALYRVPTVRTTLTAGSLAPPALVTGTLAVLEQPLIAGVGGVMAFAGNAWWGIQNDRETARKKSSVGYLLDVRDRLAPKDLIKRARRLYKGTY